MIGNAVPVNLAQFLAESILAQIEANDTDQWRLPLIYQE